MSSSCSNAVKKTYLFPFPLAPEKPNVKKVSTLFYFFILTFRLLLLSAGLPGPQNLKKPILAISSKKGQIVKWEIDKIEDNFQKKLEFQK
jgi:hypothetical protein